MIAKHDENVSKTPPKHPKQKHPEKNMIINLKMCLVRVRAIFDLDTGFYTNKLPLASSSEV